MTKRYKVLSVCGFVLVVTGTFVALSNRESDQCLVEMPPSYKLVAYDPGKSSSDLAAQIKGYSGSLALLPATAKVWMFEGDGSTSDAKKPLLDHLLKTGSWNVTAYTTGIISYSNGSGTVVMYPLRKVKGSPERHRVHVRSNSQVAGWYEKTLSKLPDGVLQMFRSKEKSEVTAIARSHP